MYRLFFLLFLAYSLTGFADQTNLDDSNPYYFDLEYSNVSIHKSGRIVCLYLVTGESACRKYTDLTNLRKNDFKYGKNGSPVLSHVYGYNDELYHDPEEVYESGMDISIRDSTRESIKTSDFGQDIDSSIVNFVPKDENISFGCILLENGQARCNWRKNSDYILLHQRDLKTLPPKNVKFSSISAEPGIANGVFCGIEKGINKVHCWGTKRSELVEKLQVNAKKIVLGDNLFQSIFCYILEDDTPKCIIKNFVGSDQSVKDILFPSNLKVKDIALRGSHICFIQTNDLPDCFRIPKLDENNILMAMGYDAFDTPFDAPMKPQKKIKVKKIAMAQDIACGIDFKNKLHCWGNIAPEAPLHSLQNIHSVIDSSCVIENERLLTDRNSTFSGINCDGVRIKKNKGEAIIHIESTEGKRVSRQIGLLIEKSDGNKYVRIFQHSKNHNFSGLVRALPEPFNKKATKIMLAQSGIDELTIAFIPGEKSQIGVYHGNVFGNKVKIHNLGSASVIDNGAYDGRRICYNKDLTKIRCIDLDYSYEIEEGKIILSDLHAIESMSIYGDQDSTICVINKFKKPSCANTSGKFYSLPHNIGGVNRVSLANFSHHRFCALDLADQKVKCWSGHQFEDKADTPKSLIDNNITNIHSFSADAIIYGDERRYFTIVDERD